MNFVVHLHHLRKKVSPAPTNAEIFRSHPKIRKKICKKSGGSRLKEIREQKQKSQVLSVPSTVLKVAFSAFESCILYTNLFVSASLAAVRLRVRLAGAAGRESHIPFRPLTYRSHFVCLMIIGCICFIDALNSFCAFE